ncbi:glycosyltransferase [Desulfosporosinus hippei]|uniref:UDP-N-acetylglucosamine transferase subunit ALG13 n=1 Tax=Desulfosporosinus hippei DSM 8344 TaxID=1121419 RepID=A0A1G8EVE9_9FIRM|nr:glycosyltransferase [Desulfosporosinus hippei]SDH73886.1 UDP-N-acetylglucosamine transferase subunit ALG13 [Desulfosporosinus hippei DSM 8344]
MIFVTVGTHEQPFNRLVKFVDELKEKGLIKEEVIIQTGFSTYEPKYCTWSKLFPYQEMVKNVASARIVITHGGPSSFIMPLQVGKIPVVVPRQKQFDEHVNNHQADFSKAVAERQGNIIVVEDMNELEKTILNYNAIVKAMPAALESNNALFNEKFEGIVDELLKERK